MSVDSQQTRNAPILQTITTNDWVGRLTAACRAAVTMTTARPQADARRGADSAGLKAAAVLIGVRDGRAPSVILTRRSAALRHHAGQISFPGGGIEPRDASPAHAACREAFEEIGLDRGAVRVLGQLPQYVTVTGFSITPIVARVAASAAIVPDGVEADTIIELPLAQALTDAAYRFRRVTHDGHDYRIYSIDYEGHHIWGATASMLVTLARAVARVDDRPFLINTDCL